MTDTVRSLFGLCCPSCGSDEHLQVMIEAWADLSIDGTDPFSDHAWDQYSGCRCANCDHHGAVEGFWVKEAVS